MTATAEHLGGSLPLENVTAASIRERYGDAGLVALAARMRAEAARLRSLNEHAGPLGLQLALNPTWVETPALRLISDEMEKAITTPGSRLMVSMPPQEGKSRLMRNAIVRALQHNPQARIAIASYQERLARKSGEAARNIVMQKGSAAKDPITGASLPDLLGIAVAANSAAAGDWSVAGRDGSVLSVGVGSGITGNAVDLLFVDDPLKGRQQADSDTIRDALHEWWDNDAESRLGPESSCIIIQTRWHEDDLIGRLTTQADDEDAVEFGVERDDQWNVINVPALADGETHDSLANIPAARTPDGWLVSARGDRVPKWSRLAGTRPRVFASLYQGRPAPLEGGVFERAWFDAGRVRRDELPELVEIAVGVDPAETGTGDAAGILVAGRAADRHLYILADLSGQLTQAQWARRVCLAWLEHNAARVIQEKNLGMRSSVPDAWSLIRRQAKAITATTNTKEALALLLASGDEHAADTAQLDELAPYAEAALDRLSSGPRVESITPKQSKMVRAQSITGLFESGKAHVVGRLPALEHESCTWQPGQRSPNRIDVMAMLLTRLDQTHMGATMARRPRHLTVVPTTTVMPLAR